MTMRNIEQFAGGSLVNQTLWSFMQLQLENIATKGYDEELSIITIEMAEKYGYI